MRLTDHANRRKCVRFDEEITLGFCAFWRYRDCANLSRLEEMSRNRGPPDAVDKRAEVDHRYESH
jgi:hypothetical protein